MKLKGEMCVCWDSISFYFEDFTKAPAMPATPIATALQINGATAEDEAKSNEPPTVGEAMDAIRPHADAIPLPYPL